MNNNQLQLLITGTTIGHLHANTPYQGITITAHESPGSTNYLFVTLHIQPHTRPGIVPLFLTDQGQIVHMIDYELMPRDVNSALRQGHTSQDAIYLITPDRFANGDTSNDNMPGMKETADRTHKNGRHGGDIAGIHQHLDYIAGLGFTAIWPTPLLENNMSRYSYHGYAITDLYQTDPRMGTNESYRAFCQQAAHHGIKVIMDMVLNHIGDEHPWMKDPPTPGWINQWQEPYLETNHRKTVQLDPYAASADIDHLEQGWFVKTMPDLNGNNPSLATYLIQNSIWWIEYAGLSGIRMDTYLYPDKSFMSRWSKAIMDEYPHLTITGEIWYDQPAVVAYWQRGKQNHDGYVSSASSLFDFPLHSALIRALTTPEGHDNGWLHLYEMLGLDFLYADPMQLVTFADNHDMPRLYTMLKEDLAKTKMALAYIATIRGIPQLYYGTEILMTSPAHRDDGLLRGDFPGGWPGDEVNAFTGMGLSTSQLEMQSFVTRLLQWRKSATVIHTGATRHYVPRDGVYVYFRYSDSQKIMVVLNKNEKEVTLDLNRFLDMIGTATLGRDILTGSKVNLTGTLTLSGPGPLILELQ